MTADRLIGGFRAGNHPFARVTVGVDGFVLKRLKSSAEIAEPVTGTFGYRANEHGFGFGHQTTDVFGDFLGRFGFRCRIIFHGM